MFQKVVIWIMHGILYSALKPTFGLIDPRAECGVPIKDVQHQDIGAGAIIGTRSRPNLKDIAASGVRETASEKDFVEFF